MKIETILKNSKPMVTYVGTDFKCYKNLRANENSYFLFNHKNNSVVARSNNPTEFDKIVYKKRAKQN